MAHLRNRFCLARFFDLADCPGGGHHAIGSPHFDSTGKPLFADPVITAVRSDIVDKDLPICTMLAASCNTRPYHSYGPVIRRIFEKAQPHIYHEVRRAMEGVMEIGDIRDIPVGGLGNQAKYITLGCVATMTSGTSQSILEKVLENFAKRLKTLPLGSTLRMPLIGTGKARVERSIETAARNIMDMMVAKFFHTLLPKKSGHSVRKLLLIHPLEYESNLLATVLMEKALFLTILDKLNLGTTDKRLVYGLGHGNKKEHQFVQQENFDEAINYFDESLDHLIKGEKAKSLKSAAKGIAVEPSLDGMYIYIRSLIRNPQGLLHRISEEALKVAKDGNIGEAYCIGNSLLSLGGKKKEQIFLNSLKNCYIDHCVAMLEARLLYENYMETEEMLSAMRQGYRIKIGEKDQYSALVDVALKTICQKLEPLREIKRKIPLRLIENTLHIVVRKLMSDYIEPSGAKRALDNLLELEKFNKIAISQQQLESCYQIYELIESIEKKQGDLSTKSLHKEILAKLLEIIPDHGTLRLEAARYYLRGEDHEKKNASLTKMDVQKAFEHLIKGHEKNPRDYGILVYTGFIIFMQGSKYLDMTEEFFFLFAKLINYERSTGKFGIRKLKSPQGEDINIPLRDNYTQKALQYYESYYTLTTNFAQLAHVLSKQEGTAALNLYRTALEDLADVGRYDLKRLYQKILGETWISLLSKDKHSIGSIPLPFGEISIDLIVNIYKKVVKYFKYRKLRIPQIRSSIKKLMHMFEKQL